MRWYDYFMCFMFADMMAAAVMAGSLLVVIPIILFEMYCYIRKEQENRR